MPLNSKNKSVVLVCLALVTLVLSIYGQTWNHDFIGVDDDVYVTANQHVADGLSAENVAWAFTSVDAANWHPLTWISHMADVQLFGMNAGGHHLVNAVIHAVSSVLLLLLLRRFTPLATASTVAALFALHPLHVESVAWVAERKDVLSALFWFATLLLYCDYATRRSRALYLACLASFVLGLMSKPMLVTLPLVLLLVDFWPLARHHEEGAGMVPLLREKIPFFACSLLSCAVTIYAQHSGGATRGLDEIPFLLRGENALTSYVAYLAKTFWPHDLALLYIFPEAIPLWQALGSLLVLIAISWAVLRVRGSHPYLVTGWFWFLITLVPVIGLVQVGAQSMADRYSYIPLVGIFIMVACGASDLGKRLSNGKMVLPVAAASLLAACVVLTWQQVGRWQDSITLYRHTLAVTEGNYLIHYNLANVLDDLGRVDEAIEHYRESLRINPRYEGAHINLGAALAAKGDLDGAIREYREALAVNPNNAKTHNNLGVSLYDRRDFAAAVREYQEALRITPGYSKAYSNLHDALAAGGMRGAGTQVAQPAAGEGR